MTATILKPQTRVISLVVPADAPDPKYTFGDRLIRFEDEDDAEAVAITAGVVVGISFADGEWSYELDFNTDKECTALINYGNPEEYAWQDEDDLYPVNSETIAKAKALKALERPYGETRAEDLMRWRKENPNTFEEFRFYKHEWNELIDRGYIPEELGKFPEVEPFWWLA